MTIAISLAERGLIPDALIRFGINRMLRQRLAEEAANFAAPEAMQTFTRQMIDAPIAINTADANQQHYEVCSAFFETVLGRRLKYSCALFAPGIDLDEAEARMLALCCKRARIDDGMDILELGCGWGSLTLWMGETFPNSRVMAVSNSASQKAFIDERARRMGIDNVEVVTCDINDFDAGRKFDRVVSVEMFEHTRNHPALFERISRWLKPDGLLFFHIFCHRAYPYFYEDNDDSDWMARQFFTGGMMPAWDLPLEFQTHLALEERWQVPGTHYGETCRQWLARHDANKARICDMLAASGDETPPEILFNRWRLFFLACEQLFDYDGGNEWYVGHYLFRNRQNAAAASVDAV